MEWRPTAARLCHNIEDVLKKIGTTAFDIGE